MIAVKLLTAFFVPSSFSTQTSVYKKYPGSPEASKIIFSASKVKIVKNSK